MFRSIGMALTLSLIIAGGAVEARLQPLVAARAARVARAERGAGGQAVSVEEFPFVSAVLAGPLSLAATHVQICGGTILTSYYVLTSAQCSEPNLSVRAGSSYSSSGGVVLDVITLTVHPDYDVTTRDSDLLLLGLSQPVTFDTPATGQGPLPFQDMPIVTGLPAFIVGWGSSWPGESSAEADQLRYATSSVLAAEACSPPGGLRATANMVCSAPATADLCPGDIGGPMVSSGVILGVAIDSACGDSSASGLYTNVARFSSWLQNSASGIPTNT